MASFNVVSVDLMSFFHLNTTQFGAFSSAYLAANAIWLIPGGILLDRLSARKVTLLFMAGSVAASFVFAFSSSIILDVLMRFVGGLGSAMSLLVTLRLAARWCPEKTALVIGLLVALGMSGGIFADAPFSYLVQQFHWHMALKISGYFGVLLWVFMYLFLHDKTDISAHSKSFNLQQLLRDLKAIVSNIQNWKCGVFIGLTNLPIFVLASLWGNTFLVQTFSIPSQQASFITSMIFIGEIIGAPIMGWFSDKLKLRRPLMIISAVLSLVMTSSILFNPNLSATILEILFFSLGFIISAQVIGYPTIIESNAPSVASTASGFGSFLVNMVGASSQILFGYLLNIHGGNIVHSTVDYHRAFSLLPIAFILAIFTAFLIHETFCKQKK